MSNSHPRFRYYPQHKDYVALALEFRPFVMATHQPLYRSPAVNTDKFGLREQYAPDGVFLDMARLPSLCAECDVVLGGSTVFGVDATSDKATLPHFLSRPQQPCLNLGIRGATCQQEVVLFLLLKQYLPKVRNVILFTGVNNCSLASLEGTLQFPDFGGIFSEEYHFNSFISQAIHANGSRALWVKQRCCSLVDRLHRRSRLGRWLLGGRRRAEMLGGSSPQPYDFEAKVDSINRFLANDLHTWGCLQQATGCKVHFVLQPAIRWTRKPLTPMEAECFEADVVRIPSMMRYATPEFHTRYRAHISSLCQTHAIDFHDASTWLNEAPYAEKTLFTDVCHLTDEGNRVMAELLRTHLKWR
jgi:hypothetical protein